MKILYCRACKDALKLLHQRIRSCSCGQTSGKYVGEGHDAEVWGRYSEVIGVGDIPLLHALKSPELDAPVFGLGPEVRTWIYPRGYEKIIRHAGETTNVR